MKKQPPFFAALLAILIFAAMMFASIVVFDAPPHIAMLLGCGAAGIIAAVCGSKWETIEQGMIRGITQALGSLIILMLIGVLIGVWILSGVVPAMIYYGLKLLSPRFFLVSAMLICSVISMAVGSWGTAGTVGLALMGVAQVMGVSAPLAAGAIISGAYLGDKISPLSDSTNLASAVTGVDIFRNVAYMAPVAGTAYLLAGALYFFLGQSAGQGGAAMGDIAELSALLEETFWISAWNFLPLLALIACILLKLPSIPGIAAGILSAAALGAIVQGAGIGELLDAAFYGYRSGSGNQLLDGLLSAGGLESMMYSVSLILCAMMFGGIMEETGLMGALMQPVFRLIHSGGQLVGATVLSCMLVNMVLPEQYVAIALPGRMFAAEYDSHGIDRRELTRALGAGGASFSPVVPCNTCGVFMAGVLGVSAWEYGRYAFLNLTIPLLAIAAGAVGIKRAGAAKQKSAIPSEKS